MQKLKQYKTARRLGARIFSKTQNPKFMLTKKPATRKHPSPISEFGLQLIEKQKMRFTYNLKERQCATYVKKAMSKKGVNPAHYLYKNLESRLDNVVYRLGFAKSRPLARQIVSHGHITVNDRRVNIPSYSVKEGDRIGIRAGSRERKLFTDIAEPLKTHTPPSWLTLDAKKIEGRVAAPPKMEVASGDVFNLGAVIGFYSR
ncbi:MAG: 30S ribosomal protein S4 [Parcubacteria group bacterium]|nr:30S ribosomal protein S4 [Parcubacteria group bacterium]